MARVRSKIHHNSSLHPCRLSESAPQVRYPEPVQPSIQACLVGRTACKSKALQTRPLMMKTAIRCLVALILNPCTQGAPQAPSPAVTSASSPAVARHSDRWLSTFSIVGFDPVSGELGVAVQSKFFGVGTVVPWAKAGVGAIATQSYANITYGPQGLALLADGRAAQEALDTLTGEDADRAKRQVGVVDARGRVAVFSGSECHPWAGHVTGTNFCAQGNLLTGPEVVQEMARAYTAAQQEPNSELADWLMAALAAGQAAGGDKRGQQSAALLVVREKGGYGGNNDRFVDLRVEDHPHPIAELSRLLAIHKTFYPDAHRPKAKEP